MKVKVDHEFADPTLLQVALTHTSYAHEHGGPDYERLEFLGDAVLQLAATAWLVERFPAAPEGDLSRLRQHLVSTAALAEVAGELGLGEGVRLGVGEEQSGGRTRPTVLAGAVEAVLGAAFMDAGYHAAERLVRSWLAYRVDALAGDENGWKDPRSLLQERTQRELGETPVYDVTSIEGPAHAPTFAVVVRAGDLILGQGTGPSKREAARVAATEALQAIGEESP